MQIYMYSGKTKEQKNELVKRISRDFEEVVGVRPESLNILFPYMEKENWGFRGTLASEQPAKKYAAVEATNSRSATVVPRQW